jgi:AmmeMemoRadiSam system protein A
MNPLVSLAKKTVEKYVKNGTVLEIPDDFPKEFLGKKAGTFVTIMEKGELRGCIGTFLPTKDNVAEEIIQNAVAAATEDWRFDQISVSELPRLSYEVSILSNPEQIKDVSDLDAKKFGIIVKSASSGNCGLLLPDLEGVNTPQEQIDICCKKGDINPKKENLLIYRFTAEKYKQTND